MILNIIAVIRRRNKLSKKYFDEILRVSNNQIIEDINEIKMKIENIINNSLLDSMSIQLKNINEKLYFIDENIKKNNDKLINIFNIPKTMMNNINKDNNNFTEKQELKLVSNNINENKIKEFQASEG